MIEMTTTLHTSRKVERLPHSRDPATAWRYECSISKSLLDDPVLRANGFARSQEEAQAKADAWQPRKETIRGLEVLISDGDELLRSEAHVPALGLSMIIERQRDLISWRVPAKASGVGSPPTSFTAMRSASVVYIARPTRIVS